MAGAMTTAEARRHDLYNGLAEFLEEDRADTLMAYLPSQESSDLATRADFDTLSHRNLTARLDAVNHRLDRIVLTLAAGLIAIVATLITQTFI